MAGRKLPTVNSERTPPTLLCSFARIPFRKDVRAVV